MRCTAVGTTCLVSWQFPEHNKRTHLSDLSPFVWSVYKLLLTILQSEREGVFEHARVRACI
jgi:hypothetical protein